LEPESIDNQLNELFMSVLPAGLSNQAGNQAGAQANAPVIRLLPHDFTLLRAATQPQSREYMLQQLRLSNNRKNYLRFMHPLIQMGWLAMTLPHKPTSPHQQYYTTRKGRLILHFAQPDKPAKSKKRTP
jgi:ATP-dependent DNA helicase RecG